QRTLLHRRRQRGHLDLDRHAGPLAWGADCSFAPQSRGVNPCTRFIHAARNGKGEQPCGSTWS
ncbi:hypothetical protein ACP0GP_25830, partial [Escherichia coli]|uniref:hypothetical protein n=1 Tax=Escherichia coli TaxID=562 RepID=UPI003CF5DEF3